MGMYEGVCVSIIILTHMYVKSHRAMIVMYWHDVNVLLV